MITLRSGTSDMCMPISDGIRHLFFGHLKALFHVHRSWDRSRAQ